MEGPRSARGHMNSKILASGLGIVDMQLRALLQKFGTDVHRRGFPRVAGVLKFISREAHEKFSDGYSRGPQVDGVEACFA